MKFSYALRRSGVTLTELLVVLVIVSILSTIAVPVYINKAENARRATAEAECRILAEAEDTCALHHGFYVPLQILDDMPAFSTYNIDDDALDRESSQIFLIDPYTPIDVLNVQSQLSDYVTNSRIKRLRNAWEGPFLNPQRVYFQSSLGNNSKRVDHPLDPWGQPYRFYAPYPYGAIGSRATSILETDWGMDDFSNGQVTQTDNEQRFERFAIVSYGPNRVSDTLTNSIVKDDIVYLFGKVYPTQTETDFFPAPGSTTPAPTSTATPINETPTPDVTP